MESGAAARRMDRLRPEAPNHPPAWKAWSLPSSTTARPAAWGRRPGARRRKTDFAAMGSASPMRQSRCPPRGAPVAGRRRRPQRPRPNPTARPGLPGNLPGHRLPGCRQRPSPSPKGHPMSPKHRPAVPHCCPDRHRHRQPPSPRLALRPVPMLTPRRLPRGWVSGDAAPVDVLVRLSSSRRRRLRWCLAQVRLLRPRHCLGLLRRQGRHRAQNRYGGRPDDRSAPHPRTA